MDRHDWLNKHAWDHNLHADEVMSKVERERFQAKLNAVTGLCDDGSPRLRLVWGAQFPETSVKNRATGLYEPRYPFKPVMTKRTNPVTGLEEMHHGIICIQRFFVEIQIPIEEFYQPGERGETPLVEAGTYTDGQKYEAADVESLRWVKFIEICQHDELTNPKTGESWCCENWLKQSIKCHGEFRKPDNYDLDYIQRRWLRASDARKSKMGEILSKEDEANIHRQMVAAHVHHLYLDLQQAGERHQEYREMINVRANGVKPQIHLGA